MNSKFKKNRRKIIKILASLGLFSIFPIRIEGFNYMEDCITTSDIEGPYYIGNSPNVSILNPPEITSNLLFITGTVYANDCITPIANAVVDIWHANKGEYDQVTNSYLNSNYDANYANPPYYRAQIYTDNNGNYAYQTIVPGKYPLIPGGNEYRPSHIHCKSSYLNNNEITTQIYFENDTSIPTDTWASNPNSANRIIPLELDEDNNYNGVFDITLNVSPSELKNSFTVNENRLIQAIYPNPINKKTNIYLKKTNQKVTIEICNVSGQVIAKNEGIRNHIINVHELTKSKFKKGIYIIRLSNSQGLIDSKRIIIP